MLSSESHSFRSSKYSVRLSRSPKKLINWKCNFLDDYLKMICLTCSSSSRSPVESWTISVLAAFANLITRSTFIFIFVRFFLYLINFAVFDHPITLDYHMIMKSKNQFTIIIWFDDHPVNLDYHDKFTIHLFYHLTMLMIMITRSIIIWLSIAKSNFHYYMSHCQMLGKVEYGLPAKIWRLVGCTEMLSW